MKREVTDAIENNPQCLIISLSEIKRDVHA